jgi:hypothetical protein
VFGLIRLFYNEFCVVLKAKFCTYIFVFLNKLIHHVQWMLLHMLLIACIPVCMKVLSHVNHNIYYVSLIKAYTGISRHTHTIASALLTTQLLENMAESVIL